MTYPNKSTEEINSKVKQNREMLSNICKNFFTVLPINVDQADQSFPIEEYLEINYLTLFSNMLYRKPTLVTTFLM